MFSRGYSPVGTSATSKDFLQPGHSSCAWQEVLQTLEMFRDVLPPRLPEMQHIYQKHEKLCYSLSYTGL